MILKRNHFIYIDRNKNKKSFDEQIYHPTMINDNKTKIFVLQIYKK